MKFDLIIPCYNPPIGWDKKIIANYYMLVDAYFHKNKDIINLIIVNDGSTKNFEEKHIDNITNSIPTVKIVSYSKNMGKGYAIRQGVKSGNAPYTIYTDYDFPFGVDSVAAIYKSLQEEIDIVYGCRCSSDYFKKAPFKRRMASKGLMMINKYILRTKIADTQAGIKGFNEYGKALFLKTTINRFLFDLEFLLLANQIEDITISTQIVNAVPDIHLTSFKFKVIRQELRNLLRIILAKKYVYTTKQDIVWSRFGRV